MDQAVMTSRWTQKLMDFGGFSMVFLFLLRKNYIICHLKKLKKLQSADIFFFGKKKQIDSSGGWLVFSVKFGMK